jgi:hypothetical protein
MPFGAWHGAVIAHLALTRVKGSACWILLGTESANGSEGNWLQQPPLPDLSHIRATPSEAQASLVHNQQSQR